MLENQIPSMPLLIQDLGVLPISEGSIHKKRFGLYACSCGTEFRTTSSSIKTGKTKSCGCYQKQRISEVKTKHGMRGNPIYSTWCNMMQRCNHNYHAEFRYYGGRGISVCSRWLDIKNFIEDMYPTFQEGLSIDRIDNNGNYEPNNCRWATKLTQSRNTRIIYNHNTSGYRGVSFYKSRNKWEVSIRVNGKNNKLGYFNTALDGAKAYDKYIIENNLEHTINGVLHELLR